MFALHYVYIPRITAALNIFKHAWNCHPLSTEENRTPLQLFTSHAILNPTFDALTVPEDYGYDPDTPDPEPEDSNSTSVDIPDTDIPLSPGSLHVLHETVNPLADSEDGIDLYVSTVQCLYQLMQAENLLH